MKKLELNQMENLEGGLTNRECMLRGFGMLLGVASGFWAAALVLGATSGDCY
jgi:hypothetical protein